jgi:Glycine zipper
VLVWATTSSLQSTTPSRIGTLGVTLLLLAGCAGDYVPRDDASASVALYESDLEACRSSAIAAKAAGGAEGFLAGALLGAANGAIIGSHKGGADVGAAIGAGVGAVVGFMQGLSWRGRSSVASCMHAKGYRRA